MAIACSGFVTILPLRPDRSLPAFISCISVATFFAADGEYFRPEDFFPTLFFALVRVAMCFSSKLGWLRLRGSCLHGISSKTKGRTLGHGPPIPEMLISTSRSP